MSAPLAASGSEPDLGAVSTKTVDAEGNATVVTVASGSVASAPAPVPEPEPLPANMKAQLDKARKAEEKYEKSPWSTNKLSEALKCYETVLRGTAAAARPPSCSSPASPGPRAAPRRGRS